MVERAARLATMRNHSQSHFLHAATPAGWARTCARPARTWVLTSCASTSPMASAWAPTSLDVENLVNTWIADSHPVRAIETTRQEAEALGAMVLFGEKYGDWVRMVEVEDVSRELCGGTHTATTAEVGIFEVTTETSSASNVRRIELTGRRAPSCSRSAAAGSRRSPRRRCVPEHEVVRAVERLAKQAKQQQKQPKQELDWSGPMSSRASADERGGSGSGCRPGDAPRPQGDACPLRRRAPWLSTPCGSCSARRWMARHLVANSPEKAVQQGLKVAPQLDGRPSRWRRWRRRDTMAQAGGVDPGKLPQVLAAARAQIESAPGEVLALDHREASLRGQ